MPRPLFFAPFRDLAYISSSFFSSRSVLLEALLFAVFRIASA